MKILLIGEYSRLHNTLKEGLLILGHEVLLIGTGDGFKNYPVDVNVNNKIFKYPFTIFINKTFYRIFKIDLSAIERGFLFWIHLKILKDFDIVQLINESSIKTAPQLEIFLLKKILKSNKALYLLSCGTDSINMKYAFEGKFKYSVITPLLDNKDNPKIRKIYKHTYSFFSKNFKKLSVFLQNNVRAIIASDMDYHIPLIGNEKYVGLIPNPINVDTKKYVPLKIDSKIKIFHGINMGAYTHKGNTFFEKALEIINNKYPEFVEIKTTRSIPYKDYIEAYNNCHILLDQVYGYDQGYNALEAMAKGKVVFTGAEQEFLDYYNLEKNQVCINALPNVESIVEELESLILNPKKIEEISKNARKFIEKEHHYIKIAQKYLEVWNSN
jgi:hypothetical protein